MKMNFPSSRKLQDDAKKKESSSEESSEESSDEEEEEDAKTKKDTKPATDTKNKVYNKQFWTYVHVLVIVFNVLQSTKSGRICQEFSC
jgi:hypothetical protein